MDRAAFNYATNAIWLKSYVQWAITASMDNINTNLNTTMNLKGITALAVLMVAPGAATLALADDVASVSDYKAPINYPNNAPHTKANYQNTIAYYTGSTQASDPDLIHKDYPNQAPHTKANYKAPADCTCKTADPDLVHNIAYINNAPHTKAAHLVQENQVAIATLK